MKKVKIIALALMPEGATHYYGVMGDLPIWYKQRGSTWYYWVMEKQDEKWIEFWKCCDWKVKENELNKIELYEAEK